MNKQDRAALVALVALVAKWRNRANPHFADPEATDSTLTFWRGVRSAAHELEEAIAALAAAPATKCDRCGAANTDPAPLCKECYAHWI
jgi:hypothetical protein